MLKILLNILNNFTGHFPVIVLHYLYMVSHEEYMKKRFGFSVLELLALLVTISIVAAALAPVFTKRVRSVNATANPSKVSQNCSNRFSAYCTTCNIR